MALVKVVAHKDLRRDSNSNAVLNVNDLEYEQYLLRKKREEEKEMLMKHQIDEINNIKEEVQEIKTLILDLVRIIKNGDSSK